MAAAWSGRPDLAFWTVAQGRVLGTRSGSPAKQPLDVAGGDDGWVAFGRSGHGRSGLDLAIHDLATISVAVGALIEGAGS